MNYPKHRYTGEKPWMNKEWLYNEYIVKDRSTFDIATEYGCKQSTLQCWLIKFGIKKQKLKHSIHNPKPHQQKEYLYEEYIVKNRTIESIAEDNNVDDSTISYFLKKYGMFRDKIVHKVDLSDEDSNEIARLYKYGSLSTVELAYKFSVSRTVIKRVLREKGVRLRSLSESQFAHNSKRYVEELDDAELLHNMHWVENMSCKDMGETLGCDPQTVRRHMKSLGIPTRNNSQSKVGKMCGDKHHNWKGGVTPLNLLLREYFHINIVPIVAKRDNYTCQECGKKHTVLHIHHIRKFSDILNEILEENNTLDPSNIDDRQKLYDITIKDERFLDEKNLITLCKQCHIKRHSKTISSQADISEGSETIP